MVDSGEVSILTMYPHLDSILDLGGMIFGDFVRDCYMYKNYTMYIHGRKHINVVIDPDKIILLNNYNDFHGDKSLLMKFYTPNEIKSLRFRYEHDGLCIRKINNTVKYTVLPALVKRLGLQINQHEAKLTSRIVHSLQSKQVSLIDATSEEITHLIQKHDWKIMDACYHTEGDKQSCLACGVHHTSDLIEVGCCGACYHRNCYLKMLISESNMTRCLRCNNLFSSNRVYNSTYCCILM